MQLQRAKEYIRLESKVDSNRGQAGHYYLISVLIPRKRPLEVQVESGG